MLPLEDILLIKSLRIIFFLHNVVFPWNSNDRKWRRKTYSMPRGEAVWQICTKYSTYIYSTYIVEGVATDISNQKIAHVEGLLFKQSICQWSCKDFCKIR